MKEATTVKEVLELGHVCVGDLLGNPYGKRMGKVTKEVAGDLNLSARCLFRNGPIVGGNDLDPPLRAAKSKVLSPVEDKISEMSLH